MAVLYGRDEELGKLQRLAGDVALGGSRIASIIGRRRIGKTALVREVFAKAGMPYSFICVNGFSTERVLVQSFMNDSSDAQGLENAHAGVRSLAGLVELFLRKSESSPTVLVIEGLEKCQDVAPSFFADLQRIWKDKSSDTKLLLVFTGSVTQGSASAKACDSVLEMSDEVIRLEPFSCDTIKAIMREHAPDYRAEDLLALYGVTGGVPGYVQHLIGRGALTKGAILHEVMSDSCSYFITEGGLLLANRFVGACAVYFDILRLIAAGTTRRADIVESFNGREISGQLFKLESVYGLVERVRPVASQSSTDFRFAITDDFLEFWFGFVANSANLIEQGLMQKLEERSAANFDAWLQTRVRAKWFVKKLREEGRYAEVGTWWKKKSCETVEVVAVDTKERKVLCFGLDAETLLPNAYAFMAGAGEYSGYDLKAVPLGSREL